MYRVIGMDGQMYGPVDLATLQRWCAEGRVAPSSTVIDERNQQMFAQSVPSLAGCFTLQVPDVTQSPNPYGSPYPQGGSPVAYPRMGYSVGLSSKSKVVAMMLALFLGFLGIHRFYLGHTATGVAMLAIAVSGCLCSGLGWVVVGIWSFIDVILIATDTLVDASGQRLN